MLNFEFLKKGLGIVFPPHLVYSFLPNCRGSSKMHQGANYQDFVKMEGGYLGHSLIIIK